LLSHVRLRYVGQHPDDEEEEAVRNGRGRRRRRRRRNRRYSASPQLDEVTIVQQPRGSYVLEVFHGFLAVGGKCRGMTERKVGRRESLS